MTCGQEYAMKILRDSLSEDDVPPDSPETRERLDRTGNACAARRWRCAACNTRGYAALWIWSWTIRWRSSSPN